MIILKIEKYKKETYIKKKLNREEIIRISKYIRKKLYKRIIICKKSNIMEKTIQKRDKFGEKTIMCVEHLLNRSLF